MMPLDQVWCVLLRTPSKRSSQNYPSETVRKVPEVPEMEPHETSQRHHSARSLPGMMARPTLGGLLEPLFGQFRKRRSRKSVCRELQTYAPNGPKAAVSAGPKHPTRHKTLGGRIQRVASILTYPQVDVTSANQTKPSSRPHVCIMRVGHVQ